MNDTSERFFEGFASAAEGAHDAAGCELACEVLKFHRSLRLGVTGWSMLPTIFPGDTLIIEHVSIEAVNEGDIVLFRRGRRLIAHRVVSKITKPKGSNLLTRGDAMDAPDPSTGMHEVLGRVTFIVRDGKLIKSRKNRPPVERAIGTAVCRSAMVGRALVALKSAGWFRRPKRDVSCPT